jgi:ribonuclease BN (tRNA processing enzyme)
MWCSGHDLAAGVDVLVHDAQYDDAEYAERIGWGHSTLHHALEFAQLVGVGCFMPFHHDPAHDDDMLDRFFASAPSDGVAVAPAHEGDHFVVENHEIRAVREVCP